MNKKIKSQLKTAFAPPNPVEKTEFLQSVNFPKATRFDFVLSQIGFIRKRVWIISFLLLTTTLSMLYFYIDETLLDTIGVISSLLPFVALVFVLELAKSKSFCMMELEMSCKYSLREITLTRLGILSGFYLLLFCVLSVAFIRKLESNLLPFTLYMFLPFLMTCALSLVVLNHIKSRESTYACGVVACLVSGLNVLCSIQYTEVFSDTYIPLWGIAFTLLIVLTISELVRYIKRMEDIPWNLLQTA